MSIPSTKLGFGSAAVVVPVGVSVTDVTWDLLGTDPSLTEKVMFPVSTTASNSEGSIYFIVKDSAGNVLQTFQNTLLSGGGFLHFLCPTQIASQAKSRAWL